MRFLSLLVLSVWGACATVCIGAEDFELPVKKTGTGAHDFYNLGATVAHDSPAQYYVVVAASGKFDSANVSATNADGAPMPITRRFKQSLIVVSVHAVAIGLTRSELEVASIAGASFKLTGKKKTITVTIPAAEFAELLKQADEKDFYRRRLEIEAAEKAKQDERRKTFERMHLELIGQATPDVLSALQMNGTSKIVGQAFLKTRGGEVKVGAGNMVMLYPANSWYEGASIAIDGDRLGYLIPETLWELIRKGMRTCQADATGNFEFENVPVGTYVLETRITWSTGVSETGGTVKRIVSVTDGGTTKIMLTE